MRTARRVSTASALAVLALPSLLAALDPGPRHPDLGSGVIASTRPGFRGGTMVWQRIGTNPGVAPDYTVTDVSVDLEVPAALAPVQVVATQGRNDGSIFSTNTFDLEPGQRRTLTFTYTQFLTLTLVSEDVDATLYYRIVRISRNS